MTSQKVGKSGFDTHSSADFINRDFQKYDFLRVHQIDNADFPLKSAELPPHLGMKVFPIRNQQDIRIVLLYKTEIKEKNPGRFTGPQIPHIEQFLPVFRNPARIFAENARSTDFRMSFTKISYTLSRMHGFVNPFFSFSSPVHERSKLLRIGKTPVYPTESLIRSSASTRGPV